MTLERLAAQWNAACPVGTKVIAVERADASIKFARTTKTASPAFPTKWRDEPSSSRAYEVCVEILVVKIEDRPEPVPVSLVRPVHYEFQEMAKVS